MDAPARSCSTCQARPGEPCRSAEGAQTATHRMRVQAARLGLSPCGECGSIGWIPETPSAADPMTLTCSACLAESGDACYSTSTGGRRHVPHRLRGLAAAARLIRCPSCEVAGWQPDPQEDR